MLSRVAERVYWLGRYMERVENTARLINVNTNLFLDLPYDSQVSWLTLLQIVEDTVDSQLFEKSPRVQEQTAMQILISDPNSYSSIINSLRCARENSRTAREIIPSEAWELINDLYLYVKENAAKTTARALRGEFLNQIIARAQQCTGLLAGSMSHNPAYNFIRLGRNLERADMTTRIVDVGAINVMKSKAAGATISDDSSDPYSSILWMNVLQSLSAYQMYRQNVLERVNGEDVVCFLLQDKLFPRAVSSCLESLKESLGVLTNNEEALRAIAAVQRRIDSVDIKEILEKEDLHEFIDNIQLDIAAIHHEINKAWFLPQVTLNASR